MTSRDRDSFDLFDEGKRERSRFGDNESQSENNRVRKSNLIDLSMVLHHETQPGKTDQGAVLVSSDGEESAAVWIPKSQCQVETKGEMVSGHRKNGQAARFPVCTVTMPSWQAESKGLV